MTPYDIFFMWCLKIAGVILSAIGAFAAFIEMDHRYMTNQPGRGKYAIAMIACVIMCVICAYLVGQQLYMYGRLS